MRGRQGARSWLVAAAVLLGLVALSAPGSAQSAAFYEVNDIEYYYATGTYASGHFAVGEGESQETQEFTGCGWAKLRPDNNKGRMQVLGLWGSTPLTIDMNDFPDANVTPDSMGSGRTIDPSLSGFTQPIDATMMATTPNATVRIGDVPILDPVTGEPQFQATWFVTKDGFRDDATGALGVDRSGAAADNASLPGPWEMHLRVTSRSDGSQGPAAWTHSEPSDGTPYLAPDEAHSRVFAVPNERLFGTGLLTVQARSLAPAGSTSLEFNVYAPDGTHLGSFPLAPALEPGLDPGLSSPATQQLEFPLDQMGDYYVEVHGAVSLASYDLTVDQAPPEKFLLDLWWDDVKPGYAGLEEREACNDELDNGVMTAYIAPRPPPVGFDWEFSLFTVGAGLTLLAVTVSLVIAAYQWVVARRAVQG